mgnify:CR=1 FL=1
MERKNLFSLKKNNIFSFGKITEKIDQKKIATFIIVVGVIIAGVIIYFKQTGFSGGFSQTLSSQGAGERIIKYVNENLLEKGVEATLLSVEDYNRFLYKLGLSINGQPLEVYTTRDGKFLFLQPPLNLDEPLPLPPVQ